MSGVNVLAVMDRLRQEWRDEKVIVGRLDSADAIDSVYAAVAELIEAGTELQLANEDLTDRKTGNVGARLKRLHKAEARFAAALSRVRGAE